MVVTLDRRPDPLAPAWHHQAQTTGCATEIAQIHESEAVLMRGAAKFGGLLPTPLAVLARHSESKTARLIS